MWSVLSPVFDERQQRLLAGGLARGFGRGGVAMVARASGMSRSTVQAGASEVDAGVVVTGRVRRVGAGRPRLVDVDPDVAVLLDDLVEPGSRGHPMSPLRWTCLSTYKLAETITGMGHPVSASTVGEILHEWKYSLQATAKVREGNQHPDRDAQFRYLNGLIAGHLAAGDPVISVDTKKKELVGQRANGGTEWQPQGEPVEVDVHDFPDPEVPKAVPYGVYDIGADEGWVTVGDDHDTAEFAVHTIGRWWDMVGSKIYPGTRRLLITADAGGSNGYRLKLWKVELAKLAARAGIEITVCHFPPGTSKWNRIEHRLFSQITMNWRGRPLTSHQVIVNLIGATTTKTGLKVRAELDTGYYQPGIKISDRQLAAVPLTRHEFHGEWNYTVHPTPQTE
jgi:Rhodopirellula transposase DDE domain